MKEEKDKKENYVVGYKGLCSDLSSKHNSKFKYELNKRYKLESDNQELELCSTGYHFCRNKENVFNFYEIDGFENHRFFEIKAYGNIVDDEDLNKNRIPIKSVTDEIEIFREIPLQEFISSPDVNYVKIDNKIPENLDLSTCKNLKSLYIYNCGSLENLSENLETLIINNCNFLENLPENLKTLKIWYCDSLKSIPENLDLSACKNLETLQILNCKNLKSIPENLPKNLKSLEIYNCGSLKSIPENLPENLETLEIYNCKNLKNQYWNKSE